MDKIKCTKTVFIYRMVHYDKSYNIKMIDIVDSSQYIARNKVFYFMNENRTNFERDSCYSLKLYAQSLNS